MRSRGEDSEYRVRSSRTDEYGDYVKYTERPAAGCADSASLGLNFGRIGADPQGTGCATAVGRGRVLRGAPIR
jgi:hypothetical protein